MCSRAANLEAKRFCLPPPAPVLNAGLYSPTGIGFPVLAPLRPRPSRAGGGRAP